VKPIAITGISVHRAEKAYDGTLWNPAFRWFRRTAVLVRVNTAAGVSGIGECWTFDTDIAALVAFLRTEIAPRVVGMDARRIEAVAAAGLKGMALRARQGIAASAVSGIDIALWDIAGKLAGRPVWKLLDGCRERVPVYASGGLYGDNKSADDLGGEIAGYVARGFTDVKMKVGALSLAEDLARVEAARCAVGPGGRIIVDALSGKSVDEARQLWQALEPASPYGLQAPIDPEDIDGMAALVAAGVPAIGLEAEYRLDAFRRLLERRAVSLLQFNVTCCGGISRALRIVALAETFKVPVTLQCASTALTEVASCHLAAARAAVDSVELHQVHDLLRTHLPAEMAQVEDGMVRLPEVPGLGIDVPDDALTLEATIP
jgi:L-alanine-DL-glutamate epimerase-like enolase superfamily enzyme